MKRPKPEKRFYRKLYKRKGSKAFELTAGESDIFIQIPKERYSKNLKKELLEKLILLREQILAYGREHKEFLSSLKPITVSPLAPEIVKKMVYASSKIGVGPMAGVAGAINLFLGKHLENMKIGEFFIENGGDTYVSSGKEITVALITGTPSIDGKLGIELPAGRWGVCSSSSKIGHSLSFGQTELVTVVGKDPIEADCAATLLGNSKSMEELTSTAEKLIRSGIITGIIGLIDGKFLIHGNIKFVKLHQ